MPRDDKIERGLVLHGRGGRPAQEVALRRLPFAIPLVFAGQNPCGISSSLCAAELRGQARCDGRACPVVDRSGMFAAQSERFKEALTD